MNKPRLSESATAILAPLLAEIYVAAITPEGILALLEMQIDHPNYTIQVALKAIHAESWDRALNGLPDYFIALTPDQYHEQKAKEFKSKD